MKDNHTDETLRVIYIILKQFGWEIKTGNEQKYGSSSDIYAEINNEYGRYLMIIDDGNCCNGFKDAIYHIYVENLVGKIFEGRIYSIEDFNTVMRMLGFNKIILNE